MHRSFTMCECRAIIAAFMLAHAYAMLIMQAICIKANGGVMAERSAAQLLNTIILLLRA